MQCTPASHAEAQRIASAFLREGISRPTDNALAQGLFDTAQTWPDLLDGRRLITGTCPACHSTLAITRHDVYHELAALRLDVQELRATRPDPVVMKDVSQPSAANVGSAYPLIRSRMVAAHNAISFINIRLTGSTLTVVSRLSDDIAEIVEAAVRLGALMTLPYCSPRDYPKRFMENTRSAAQRVINHMVCDLQKAQVQNSELNRE